MSQASDVVLLSAERERIKAKLFADYGAELEVLMADADLQRQALSPAQQREKRLADMVSERAPLRQQVRSAQDEAIAKLLTYAEDSEGRGADVADRMTILTAMQRQNTATREAMGEADEAASPAASAASS
jgi:hypothetical protein